MARNKKSITLEEIRDSLRDVLIESLGVDENEVTATASIRNDLGAESLDWLDITFRIEKKFGIRIPKTDPNWNSDLQVKSMEIYIACSLGGS